VGTFVALVAGCMRSLLRLATCALVVAGTATTALAVARHERVSIKPLKEGRKTVGFKVRLTLYSETYTRVRIGVGSAGKLPSGATVDKRKLAAGTQRGYIRHRIAEVKGLSASAPKEVEYQVRFDGKNKLKPGQMIDIVTAWNSSSNGSYWHVFGMKNGPVQSGTTYKVPR
jgi:hypothetical protein